MFSSSVSGNALTISTDAGNLVIPAGTTFGASNGIPFRLWVTNNGGMAATICSLNGAVTRPLRPLGSITFESGLPVSGQWSSSGDGGVVWLPGDPLPGDVLFSQQVSFPEYRSPNPPTANHWY